MKLYNDMNIDNNVIASLLLRWLNNPDVDQDVKSNVVDTMLGSIIDDLEANHGLVPFDTDAGALEYLMKAGVIKRRFRNN